MRHEPIRRRRRAPDAATHEPYKEALRVMDRLTELQSHITRGDYYVDPQRLAEVIVSRRRVVLGSGALRRPRRPGAARQRITRAA